MRHPKSLQVASAFVVFQIPYTAPLGYAFLQNISYFINDELKLNDEIAFNSFALGGEEKITYPRKQPEVEARGASIRHFLHDILGFPHKELRRRQVAQKYHCIFEPPQQLYQKQ